MGTITLIKETLVGHPVSVHASFHCFSICINAGVVPHNATLSQKMRQL